MAAVAAIAGRSRLIRMNGAVELQSWTSSSSIGSTSSTVWIQLLVSMQVGHETARVDRGAGGDPFQATRSR